MVDSSSLRHGRYHDSGAHGLANSCQIPRTVGHRRSHAQVAERAVVQRNPRKPRKTTARRRPSTIKVVLSEGASRPGPGRRLGAIWELTVPMLICCFDLFALLS